MASVTLPTRGYMAREGPRWRPRTPKLTLSPLTVPHQERMLSMSSALAISDNLWSTGADIRVKLGDFGLGVEQNTFGELRCVNKCALDIHRYCDRFFVQPYPLFACRGLMRNILVLVLWAKTIDQFFGNRSVRPALSFGVNTVIWVQLVSKCIFQIYLYQYNN